MENISKEQLEQPRYSGRTNSHRAVAAVVGTLLMVSITVMASLMLMVFAQDFFDEVDEVSVQFDIPIIVGYDARDLDGSEETKFIDHTGELIETNTSDEKDGEFADGDHLVIYVKNDGTDPIEILSVRLGDSTYLYVNRDTGDKDKDDDDNSNSSTISDSFPGEGEFIICIEEGCDSSDEFTDESAIIDPGQKVTIILEKDETGVDFSVGSKPRIVITTENDGIAFTTVVVGSQRGA